MKFEYKKKFKDELILSERQLEQISAFHIVDMFIQGNSLNTLQDINPKWVELHRYKDFQIGHIEELEKSGVLDYFNFKVRKTKKGYVLEMKFNWRSKGIKTTPIVCVRCKKVKKLNWHFFCEKCTKEVGGSKGITKFWRKKL